VVEISRGTLTRVRPNGTKEVVAETGGGPNGAAIGPDGKVYICNNGGLKLTQDGSPTEGLPPGYTSGCIQRVDLASGKVEVLYTECNGHPLRGPNDIVFDSTGGFWFTDFGKVQERQKDRTAIYYAKPDGSLIKEMIFPIDGPNGIGLAPGDTRLYAAQTFEGRVWQWDIPRPGELSRTQGEGGPLLAGPGAAPYDTDETAAADTVAESAPVQANQNVPPVEPRAVERPAVAGLEGQAPSLSLVRPQTPSPLPARNTGNETPAPASAAPLPRPPKRR